MTRMAGSTDAKRAWVFLRGPYLLAYIGYFILAVFADPGHPSNFGSWWVWVATILGMMLLAGSLSSWMVVSHREPKSFWKAAESLEVTALRMAGVVELVYGFMGLLVLRETYPSTTALAHILIGLFFGGIYSNLSWHKIRLNLSGPLKES